MLDLNQLMKFPILAVPGIEPGSERIRRVQVKLTTTLRATITPHHHDSQFTVILKYILFFTNFARLQYCNLTPRTDPVPSHSTLTLRAD